MATRAPFLAAAYGGYHHRDVPVEDEELTHVGPGTPCGEYLRRFWQPVVKSEELGDLPVSLRIMGEDLVVFRDKSGAVGLLELHCPHRGTSLEFGLVGDRGIRCCYHGWLMDVDGRILETPGEPSDSTLKDRLCHGAYPIHEYSGLLFAYMGPPDKKPAFPVFDTYQLPGYYMEPGPRYTLPCNWLQVKENSMDPAHLSFLHTLPGSQGFTPDLAGIGYWDFIETPIGLSYVDTKRDGDKVWVRLNDFIPPNLHQFPPNTEALSERKSITRPWATLFSVPVDDTHTQQIGFRRALEGQQARQGAGFGQVPDRSYEERQRVPGDYDAQTTQRTIAVHGLEHLGATDRGVIMLRNVLRQGIRDVQEGRDPQGIFPPRQLAISTYAGDRVIPDVPVESTPEADRQLLRDLGRKVAREYIESLG